MKIEIGKELFQWEKKRHVHIYPQDSDPEATYVQFYNKKSKTSHEIQVKDGTAQIPNYLLKEGLPITAAACIGEPGKTMVIARREFEVLKRAMPAEYIDDQDEPPYPGEPEAPEMDDEIIYDGGEEE